MRRRFWLTEHAARRALLPLRIRRIWRRGTRAQVSEGVGVVGLFRDTRGVAQAARLFADALARGGVHVRRLDAGPALGAAPILPEPANDSNGGALRTVVSCLNPPELIRWLDATGGRDLRGRRHIGYWAWELAVAPAEWRSAFRYVDEVWCHSEFAVGALRAIAPAGVPVRVLRLPVFMTAEARPDRARFGLPAGACVVLAAMDLRSTSARKNPLGALAAFRAAVPQPDGRTVLACKLSGLESDTAAARAMRDAAAARPDILLLTEVLSEREMSALIASADVVLSLHRAEGFGLLPAEAAWLGRAVVTTGWSAPVEFLSPDAAVLVGWRLVPVEDGQGLYDGVGALWAEPDVTAAAAALGRLIADPDMRAALGAKAAAHARVAFDPAVWTAHVRSLLADAG